MQEPIETLRLITSLVLWTRDLSAGPCFSLHLLSSSIEFLPLNNYCCLPPRRKGWRERGWHCFFSNSILLKEAAAFFPQAKQDIQIGLDSPVPPSFPSSCQWRQGEPWCLASRAGRRREEGLSLQAYCALENSCTDMFKIQFLDGFWKLLKMFWCGVVGFFLRL